MAKEVVVTRTLTEEMKKAGAEIIRRLDEAGILVRSSAWWHISESKTWRLLIASPQVKTDGLSKVYHKIQGVLSKMPADEPSVALKDITAVECDDPRISSLRSMYKTGGTILSGVSVTSSAVDGYFIDDAFIYRST